MCGIASTAVFFTAVLETEDGESCNRETIVKGAACTVRSL